MSSRVDSTIFNRIAQPHQDVSSTTRKGPVLLIFRVLIHQNQSGILGQAPDIGVTGIIIDKLRTKLFSIISEHSGQPYERVAANGMRDFWVTVKEVLNYGIVDQLNSYIFDCPAQ